MWYPPATRSQKIKVLSHFWLKFGKFQCFKSRASLNWSLISCPNTFESINCNPSIVQKKKETIHAFFSIFSLQFVHSQFCNLVFSYSGNLISSNNKNLWFKVWFDGCKSILLVYHRFVVFLDDANGGEKVSWEFWDVLWFFVYWILKFGVEKVEICIEIWFLFSLLIPTVGFSLKITFEGNFDSNCKILRQDPGKFLSKSSESYGICL